MEYMNCGEQLNRSIPRSFKGCYLLLFASCLSLLTACQSCRPLGPSDSSLAWVKTAVYPEVAIQSILSKLTQEPHPLGSPAQAELAKHLYQLAKDAGFEAGIISHSVAVPNPVLIENPNAPAPLTLELTAHNVWARARLAPKHTCDVVIASHFDSKRFAEFAFVGAYDSGFSSALLLPLLQSLVHHKNQFNAQCDVTVMWFDGEEAYLNNWSDGETVHPSRRIDHTYGSRYIAGELYSCGRAQCLPRALQGKPLRALILLDLLGTKPVLFTRDQYSAPALVTLLSQTTQVLAGRDLVAGETQPVEDDHVPFMNKGIPVLDIINFENRAHWHQPTDTRDILDPESMILTFRIALAVAAQVSATPP